MTVTSVCIVELFIELNSSESFNVESVDCSEASRVKHVQHFGMRCLFSVVAVGEGTVIVEPKLSAYSWDRSVLFIVSSLSNSAPTELKKKNLLITFVQKCSLGIASQVSAFGTGKNMGQSRRRQVNLVCWDHL